MSGISSTASRTCSDRHLSSYPALDVQHADGDLVLALVDDYSPTAVVEAQGVFTVFFADGPRRDAARDAIRRAFPDAHATPRDVDDEDWARRSQESLGPIAVGRVTIVPRPASPVPDQTIVICPSMAFGTGHHATTRLCLSALQTLNLADTFVLDVGTGSGVLAIAARMLGAAGALGIDHDPDAIQCARDNLALNPGIDHVSFELADVVAHIERPLPPEARPQVVTANLTGTLLCQIAPGLAQSFAPGGALIVSGVLIEEQAAVAAAFPDLDVVWEETEDEWAGLGFARFER
jgi:ribosomal protein L11 methyltransferase